MDVRFELNGVSFVWDEAKARRNLAKHSGIGFPQAAQAFFDPFLKVVDAERNQEARDAIIGMDLIGALLFVVHLVVEDDHIRIISARRATGAERTIYEDCL
jgi:uncharacterized protein